MVNHKAVREKLVYVADSDLEIKPSAIYHENSKVGEAFLSFDRPDRVTEQLVAGILETVGDRRGRYPYCRAIPLRATDQRNQAELAAVLSTRRSNRSFATDPVSMAELSSVLSMALGNTGTAQVTDTVRIMAKAYPSAGGLYPVQVYPIVLNIDGLERGVYYCDVDEDCLRFIAEAPGLDFLESAFLGDRALVRASAILILTAIVPRSSVKYGERGFRYCLIETGHVAQNLLLSCTAAELAAYTVGGFIENQVESLLHIDGVEEIALYSVALGTKSDD